MFSRSSSSSMSRRTYGLDATDRAASPAFALLLCAPMGLLRSFPGCRGRLPSCAIPIRLQGDLQHIADVVGVDEVQSLPLLLGDLLDIPLVPIGHDHLLDPGALRGERLLLQSTDREDLAGQRD